MAVRNPLAVMTRGSTPIIVAVCVSCCLLVLPISTHRSIHKVNRTGNQPLVLSDALQSVVDVIRYFKWKQATMLLWTPDGRQSIIKRDFEIAARYLKARIPFMFIVKSSFGQLGLEHRGVNATRSNVLNLTPTCNFLILDADKAPNELFEQAAYEGLFEIKCSWILYSRTLPGSQLKAIGHPVRAQVTLMRLNQPMKPLIAVSSIPASEVSIRDVFRSTGNEANPWYQVEFAVWSRSSGVRLHERWATKDHRALGERSVMFTSLHIHPFVLVRFGKPLWSAGAVIGGYIKDIFDILLDQGIFRPEYSISWSNTGLGLVVNGSLTGIVGRLARREVDLAMAGLAMFNSRAKVVRYTNHGIYRFYMGISLAKPKVPMTWKSYVMPFRPVVWIATVVMMTIAVVLLVVVALFAPKADSSLRHGRFSMAYWILSGSLVMQVWDATPGMASKIILGAVHVFTVITFIYYTSLFTSVLSYSGNELPINNLEDVLAHDEYRVLALPSTSFYNHFKDAKNGVFSEIWNKKLSKENVEDLPQTINDAIQLVKLQKAVFVSDIPAVSSVAHTDCDVVFANARYFPSDAYIGSRLDFPYIRMISFQLLLFKERGLVNRLMKRTFPTPRDACVKVSHEVPDSLAIVQVCGLFVVLAAGIFLSFVALATEIIVWHSRPM